MTRLEHLLLDLDYPEDVARLKEQIPALFPLPDALVQALYHKWSEDLYCASWLILSDGLVQEFKHYLEADV